MQPVALTLERPFNLMRRFGAASLAIIAAIAIANALVLSNFVTGRLLDREAQVTMDLVQNVLQADGYIFATPENLASMAGLMKDFFDRCYYPVLERINGRPYTTLVCAGSDGHNAVRQLERIATGWRLKAVAAPLIVCTHAQTPADILRAKQIGPQDLAKCREIGAALAAGLALGVF